MNNANCQIFIWFGVYPIIFGWQKARCSKSKAGRRSARHQILPRKLAPLTSSIGGVLRRGHLTKRNGMHPPRSKLCHCRRTPPSRPSKTRSAEQDASTFALTAVRILAKSRHRTVCGQVRRRLLDVNRSVMKPRLRLERHSSATWRIAWCGRGDSNPHCPAASGFSYQPQLSLPPAGGVCGLDYPFTMARTL